MLWLDFVLCCSPSVVSRLSEVQYIRMDGISLEPVPRPLFVIREVSPRLEGHGPGSVVQGLELFNQ